MVEWLALRIHKATVRVQIWPTSKTMLWAGNVKSSMGISNRKYKHVINIFFFHLIY